MHLSIEIKNVQHVKNLVARFDLKECAVVCIAGKNGCGKTTLMRSLQNIRTSNIFRKTASPYIFKEQSEITYIVDGEVYVYKYNEKIKHIDSKKPFPKKIKDSIHVEMPIPHGVRFSRFSNLASIDEELRKKIALKDYTCPIDLQRFLFNVYGSSKFDDLKEVSIKGESYYFLLRDGGLYIREDYFSSGEYFLVNLYRLISKKRKFIAVDELDISLDASAQVKLVAELRRFCQEYRLNIFFTTHSLPLMKTLECSELHYMECVDGESLICQRSYNFVKSTLFGFVGWDRYLLVEDEMAKSYLEYLLAIGGEKYFYRYKLIFVGGSSQVVSLMGRNSAEEFLSEKKNVIAVLDGDRSGEEKYLTRGDVCFLPFSNVENEILKHYESGKLPIAERIEVHGKQKNRGKNFYGQLIKRRLMTEREVFCFLTVQSQELANALLERLSRFLGKG